MKEIDDTTLTLETYGVLAGNLTGSSNLERDLERLLMNIDCGITRVGWSLKEVTPGNKFFVESPQSFDCLGYQIDSDK